MSQSSLRIRVGVCWDLENTSAPDGLSNAQAANITQALKNHLGNPSITLCGYGDAGQFSSKQREGCEAATIKFKDIASKRPEAADKSIILDMFQFALDDPPPSYTVPLKFQLTSVDVKIDDLEKFLEGFCIGIPSSIFEIVYQHQKYETSLKEYYRRFGVKDVEGLCQEIPNVAMLIENKKTITKSVMYAPVVKRG